MPVTSLCWAPLSPPAKPSLGSCFPPAWPQDLSGAQLSPLWPCHAQSVPGQAWQSHLKLVPALGLGLPEPSLPPAWQHSGCFRQATPAERFPFPHNNEKVNLAKIVQCIQKLSGCHFLCLFLLQPSKQRDLPSFLCDHYLNCIVSI